VIRDPERHCRRGSNGFVDAAKIVVRNVQAHGRRVVFQLFAEPVCQSRKPTRRHADRKVAALNVAGRNVCWRAGYYLTAYRYIDEATGYQEVRDKHALQALLDAFLRKELAAWAKRFPDEFYEQIFRLRGWRWKGRGTNPPQVVAAYTKDIVYARLAPQILEELERKNPIEGGRRRAKHHQWLTDDVGHPALAQHLHAVITLMRVARSWAQFKQMLDLAHPRRGDTLQLPLMMDIVMTPPDEDHQQAPKQASLFDPPGKTNH
jgi:hypothetical protein